MYNYLRKYFASYRALIHLKRLTPYFKVSIVLMLEGEHAQEDRGKWCLKMKLKILLQITYLAFDILAFLRVYVTELCAKNSKDSDSFIGWPHVDWQGTQQLHFFFYYSA